MKKISILVLFTMLFINIGNLNANPSKLDGQLKILTTNKNKGKSLLGKAVHLDMGVESVLCLLKTNDPDLTATAITALGGTVRSYGNIMSVSLPITKIEDISDRDEVVFIESSKPLISKMDRSRALVNVDDVQAGTGLAQAYTGTNVLVGVADDVIDWSNSDFTGSDGETRICYLRQEINANNTETNEIETTITECTKSTIDDSTCEIADGGMSYYYHGTHVTGIAASSNSTYKGVAPDAFIAFAFNFSEDAETTSTSTNSFSTSLLEDVRALFDKADELDLPAVVNISLGTSLGAHDDTSLLEQGLNAEVSGKQGRVIVDAAGNENFSSRDVHADQLGGIHAPIDLTAENRAWKVAIRHPDISDFDNIYVDVWLENTTACRNSTLEVKAYSTLVDGTSTGQAGLTTTAKDFTSDQTSVDNQTSDGKIEVDVSTFTEDARNNRPHGLVDIHPTNSTYWSTALTYYYDIILRVPSSSCAGDMWLYPDQTGLVSFWKGLDGIDVDGANSYTLADGDSNKTITIPGTASGVITVGSYMGYDTWTDLDGDEHDQTDYDTTPGGPGGTGGTVGDISLFSSLGPTGEEDSGDARTKPDIIAPGEPIVSTRATSVNFTTNYRLPDSTHLKLEGTSMSSPFVTGVVALMLEKNNCLTAAEVKNYLTSTATAVGTQPNNITGYGKINALDAIGQFAANTSCYTGTTCGTSSSSSSTSSGCGSGSTIMPTTSSISLITILLMLSPLGIFIIRRKLSCN